MKRLLQPFRRLQWKLTFSYIWITLVTQLVLVVLIFGVVFLFSINTFQNAQLNGVKVQTVQVSTYFLQTPPDTAGLNGWLRQQYTSVAAQSIYNNASLNADPTASSLDAGNFMLVIDQRGLYLPQSARLRRLLERLHPPLFLPKFKQSYRPRCAVKPTRCCWWRVIRVRCRSWPYQSWESITMLWVLCSSV